jgi:hypothetical protein
MAVRGSGIGASLMAGGIGMTSTRSGSAQGTYGMGNSSTDTRVQTHHVLVVLVLLEVLALFWLRHAFRDHQGG